jgi:hypothetical protein
MGIAHFSPNGLRLVCVVHSSIRFGSACSLSLEVCDFTISCNLSAFPLYIEGFINVVKLLGEASLAAINAIKLYVYAAFNFHKFFQLTPFCHNRHFFAFFYRLSFSHALKLFKCVVQFRCDFFVSAQYFASCYGSAVHRPFSVVALSPLFLHAMFPSKFCIFFLFCFLFLFPSFSPLYFFLSFFYPSFYHSTLCTCLSYCVATFKC